MQLGCRELADAGVPASPVAATTGVGAPNVEAQPPSPEELAFRFGPYYDSYLATEPGREVFWSRDGRGMVAFVRMGRYLQAGGGLIAPRGQRETLLAELIARAESRGESLSFYNVAENDLTLFRRWGFQATKLGEEAVIDLDGWSCRGGAFEWLRRQVNYCRRHELRAYECGPDITSGHQWQRLAAETQQMSAAFLAAKPQAGELRFLDGSFDPFRFGRRRLFAARSAGGRLEGFLVCNPYLGGDGWAFEIYRQRHDAVRGTIPFLMHEAIEALKQEDVRRVSLCLVPGLRAQTPLPGDSRLARRGLALGSGYFNFIFDAAGLYHYKSRFRPRFESRYLCARPALSLGSAWALVRLLGVLDIDFGKLARLGCQRLRKRRRRVTLAMPD
jgi:phosphatidylglycerol lysyltransferase